MQIGKEILLLMVFVSVGLHAQQNFVNVPSSELTKKGKLFFQQQLNFNRFFQANSTLDFGLGKGFEVGCNLLGLDYNKKNNSFPYNDTNERHPYNPLLAFNALKQFKLTEKTSLNFGGQLGMSLNNDKKKYPAGLIYANYAWSDYFGDNSQLVVGVYYNSLHYGGEGNRLGIWAGTQVPITKKIHAMTETVIGSNANCYTTLAGMYYMRKWLPLTLGVQIPNTSRNAYSVVFEITFVPH